MRVGYLSLLLHLLLEVIKVGGLSVVVLGIETLLQPALLLQALVLLALFKVRLHQWFAFLFLVALHVLSLDRETTESALGFERGKKSKRKTFPNGSGRMNFIRLLPLSNFLCILTISFFLIK